MSPDDTPRPHVGKREAFRDAGAGLVQLGRPRLRKRSTWRMRAVVAVLVLGTLCSLGACLALLAKDVKEQLTAAASLFPEIRAQLAGENKTEAQRLLSQVQDHTRAARNAVRNPLWEVSMHIPYLGRNFTAVSEVAEAADSVATQAGGSLVEVTDVLLSDELLNFDGSIDLALLESTTAKIDEAALATSEAASRLERINKRELISQISHPLDQATLELGNWGGKLRQAANISAIIPDMLGAAEPRNYLVLVQNSAEVRATGGLPGALAVIRVESGKMTLTAQASGSELGKFIPPIGVDPDQERIFTSRLGAYISDVNLTPDFPSAARTAKAMWELRYGTPIDGVVAIDPVVLSHILNVSGPLPLSVPLQGGDISTLAPALTAENVVQTLLSDIYAVTDNAGQDLFFAAAATQIFEVLSSGDVPLTELLRAGSISLAENRLHFWSGREDEQRVVESTGLGGSTSNGPDAGPNSFGAFFNDGTGAKMDFYVKRTVQLVESCPQDGYEQTTVRISATNAAPSDAASTLPVYVTGGGAFGIQPGSVQTNLVVYGPAGANIETATTDDSKRSFASYLHGDRPVGVLAIQISPGESRTVDFMFTNAVQQSEATLTVTPTVHSKKDVQLPTLRSNCS